RSAGGGRRLALGDRRWRRRFGSAREALERVGDHPCALAVEVGHLGERGAQGLDLGLDLAQLAPNLVELRPVGSPDGPGKQETCGDEPGNNGLWRYRVPHEVPPLVRRELTSRTSNNRAPRGTGDQTRTVTSPASSSAWLRGTSQAIRAAVAPSPARITF